MGTIYVIWGQDCKKLKLIVNWTYGWTVTKLFNFQYTASSQLLLLFSLSVLGSAYNFFLLVLQNVRFYFIFSSIIVILIPQKQM